MRLFLIRLYVFIFSVILINGDSEQSVVNGRYNLNRPPWAEDYNPIPVAVVYDDVIPEKLIKTSVESVTQNVGLEESTITEETETEIKESSTIISLAKRDEKIVLAKPRARALSDLQIPVAVVYDPTPDTQSSLQTKTPTIKTQRRKVKKLKSRKLVNKTTFTVPIVQSTEPTVQKTESSVEPQFATRQKVYQSNARKQRTRERDPFVPITNSETIVQSIEPTVRKTESSVESQFASRQNVYQSNARKQRTRERDPFVPITNSETIVQSTEPTVRKTESSVEPQFVSRQKVDQSNVRKQKTREPDPFVPIKNAETIVQSTEPTVWKTESSVEPQFASRQKVDQSNVRKQRTREPDPFVPIINSENYVFAHSGNFHYSYEGGDGTRAHSEGQLMRNQNDEAGGEAVSGGFSYTDKDGNDFSLSYTADERGYLPVGAHIPTSPPIPPAIARALAYLATATTPESITKPSKVSKTI